MSVRLTRLTLKGFKTIKDLRDFEPQPLNILIGANGAGKSNFIYFFRLLSWMTSERLQEHVAGQGGARTLLHDGPDVTHEIEAEVCLETESGLNDYRFRLFYAARDTLLFADEKYRFTRAGSSGPYPWNELGAGHKETQLPSRSEQEATSRVMLALLRKCIVHQFHNTAPTSRMRGKWSQHDSRYLKEDGANLAAFLFRLQMDASKYYRRIVEVLRMILPFFVDFELEADNGQVLLQWREEGTDEVFDASQASDGMLRTVALVALLGQPESNLPAVLVLDEPELGLHPYAIHVVAGMLRAVSQHCQIFVATQSTSLIDNFEPEDVVVVDRSDRESSFTRLDSKRLEEWLEEYSIAELWEKNVIGGRPS